MRRFSVSLSKYSKLLETYNISHHFPRVITPSFMDLSSDFDIAALNAGLATPIYDMFDRGGKNWRSTLCLITSQLFNLPMEPIVPLAHVVEMIHTGSLICDDIEDKSEKRRGKPCTYKIFGIDRALNSGNFLYFFPLSIILKAQASDKIQQALVKDYSDEMINLHLGQCTDIEWNNSDVVPREDQYLRMVSNKTSVLARLGVKFALRFANQSEKVNAAVIRHAESIGISFQIWDDIINLESEEYAKGRSYLGEDITEGKKTLIVLKALEMLPSEAGRLREILMLKTNNLGMVGEALEIIRRSGALDYCKKFAEDVVKNSWKDVEQHLSDGEAKDDLFHISFKLINRKS